MFIIASYERETSYYFLYLYENVAYYSSDRYKTSQGGVLFVNTYIQMLLITLVNETKIIRNESFMYKNSFFPNLIFVFLLHLFSFIFVGNKR